MKTPTVDELVSMARQLSPEEQSEVVDRVASGIPLHSDPEVAAAWDQELARRIDEMESREDPGSSFDDVLKSMDDQLAEYREREA